jgi:hypothetical protein
MRSNLLISNSASLNPLPVRYYHVLGYRSYSVTKNTGYSHASSWPSLERKPSERSPQHTSSRVNLKIDSHVRIYPWHICVDHALWERPHKTIRDPFVRVFTPDSLAAVDGRHTNPELLTLAKRQRADRLAVGACYGGLKGKQGVRRCAEFTPLVREQEKVKGAGTQVEEQYDGIEGIRKKSYTRSCLHRYRWEESERFTNNAVKQRQCHELLIFDPINQTRILYLGAQLVLCIWMERKQVQDTRDAGRRGVEGSKC